MQFIKNLFKDERIIGLSGLKKQREFVRINLPENYKRTFIPNTERNIFLV